LFDPSSNDERKLRLVTSGSHSVLFWTFHDSRLRSRSPLVREKVPLLTGTTYCCNSRVISSTNKGDVIFWDDESPTKMIRLGDGPITSLCGVNCYVCAGYGDGSIKFYNSSLRLMAWFDDMNAGAVSSVEFGAFCSGLKDDGRSVDDDDEFDVPPFVVGTERGSIVSLTANAFQYRNGYKRSGQVIVPGGGEGRIIKAVATHPLNDEFVLFYADGDVHFWDIGRLGKDGVHPARVEHVQGGVSVTAAVFQPPLGNILAVGTADGSICMYSVENLVEMVAFHSKQHAIMVAPCRSHVWYFVRVANGWRVQMRVGLW